MSNISFTGRDKLVTDAVKTVATIGTGVIGTSASGAGLVTTATAVAAAAAPVVAGIAAGAAIGAGIYKVAEWLKE